MANTRRLLAFKVLIITESNYLAKGLEVGSIRRIQGIGYGVLEFLGVGTTFDIFQNIHILYLEYGVLSSSGYGVLIFFPLWSLLNNKEEWTTKDIQCQLTPKELIPWNFTLPCTIGNFNFFLMADLGASVNVIPRNTFEYLRLANLRNTNMLVEMADMTKKAPLGLLIETLDNAKEQKDGVILPWTSFWQIGKYQNNSLVWGDRYVEWCNVSPTPGTSSQESNNLRPRDYTFREWTLIKTLFDVISRIARSYGLMTLGSLRSVTLRPETSLLNVAKLVDLGICRCSGQGFGELVNDIPDNGEDEGAADAGNDDGGGNVDDLTYVVSGMSEQYDQFYREFRQMRIEQERFQNWNADHLSQLLS
ncbi:mutator type transposase [Tanacetum coccineum]